MAALQTNITVLPFLSLQVLPDNLGNQSHCYVAFLVYMGDDKGHLILFPYVLDGELGETSAANYFSKHQRCDCAVL